MSAGRSALAQRVSPFAPRLGLIRAPARGLARLHLREVGKRIDAALADKQAPADDTTRAHLEECRERITQVLSAAVQVNEP